MTSTTIEKGRLNNQTPFAYIPIQLVVPNAVRMAVITDAIICSVHFKVSRFVIIFLLSFVNALFYLAKGLAPLAFDHSPPPAG